MSSETKTDGARPPRPIPTTCGCGELAPAVWIEPVYGASMITGGRPMLGTGVWETAQRCPLCQQRKDQAEQARVAAERATAHAERVARALAGAGFAPREEELTWGGLRTPAAVTAALEDWVRGEKALYLHGRDTGTGKTGAAVAALKRYIARTGERGLYRPVPLLMKNLRQAIGRFRDGVLTDELRSVPALVLDDIGVERPTETVLEALYLVVDDWYRMKRPQLIITSNLPLEELSKRLDDRIASRIAGHCRVIEFAGRDRRLPGFEGGR